MRFKVDRPDRDYFEPLSEEAEIDTVEALRVFQQAQRHTPNAPEGHWPALLILDFFAKDGPTIEIYNSYRE